MMPTSWPVVVGDRQTRDAEASALRVDLGQRVGRLARDGIGHHAGLGALDGLDLCCLNLDGRVAVQHTHAAGACHRNCHARLGDGVHRRTDQRNPQTDVAGQLTGRVDLARDDVGRSRQQQHVVESQSQHCDLVGVVSAGVYMSCRTTHAVRTLHGPRFAQGDRCSSRLETDYESWISDRRRLHGKKFLAPFPGVAHHGIGSLKGPNHPTHAAGTRNKWR